VGVLIALPFAFLPCNAQQPPPSAEPSITAKQLTAVSLAANPADASHKSIKVTFETEAGNQKLPKTFVAMINGQEVQLTNMGNGLFAGIVKMDEPAETVNVRKTRIVNGKTMPAAAGSAPQPRTFECTIETVDCPPNCKGDIFGGPCIICLKITCKIVVKVP